MPLLNGRRPLKRWCYVGVFGPELMLCAGSVHVAGLPQSFWAVWDREKGDLQGETRLVGTGRIRVAPSSVRVQSRQARLELSVTTSGEPIEVVSPHGGSYIWTRKTPASVHGHLAIGMEVRPVSGFGLIDESVGYHARETDWEWSAGVGTSTSGEPVTWNLVKGIHDSDVGSERTVWVSGVPTEVPPVRFGPDLDEVWGADGSTLGFVEEATRRRRDNLGVVRSNYVQPFGRFSGTLPGGTRLADDPPAFGVMERHSARW